MRLSDFFPMVEATAQINMEWALSLVHRFDRSATPLRGPGLFGRVFNGSGGTVWKLTDLPDEVAAAHRLVGRETETIVPVVEVHDLPEPHPQPERAHGPLALIRTRRLEKPDGMTAEAISLFRRFAQPDQDQVVDMAQALGIGVSEFASHVKRVRVWIRKCRTECQSFGITNPDLFEGEDNVRMDRDGNLRLIDLGDLGDMGSGQ